jgi:hypothetical protein
MQRSTHNTQRSTFNRENPGRHVPALFLGDRLSQLIADLHKNLSEPVGAFTLVDAPDLVVPGVAFFEIGVAGGEEFGAEGGVAGELVADAGEHDLILNLWPIIAIFEGLAGVFGLGGSGQGGDDATLGHVQGFGGLVGMLDVGVGEAFEDYSGGVEVGEETVVAGEAIDD